MEVTPEIEAFYDFPSDLARPWLRTNFVSSLDGAVSVRGSSRGLSSPADQLALALIRDLSDVVLVGAGTALTEGYHGVQRHEVDADRRARFGLSEVPPIAVVTARCSLEPDSPLLTDTVVPPIVLTCASAPEARRIALADAGADVVVAGDRTVDLAAALTELAARGLLRIGCEGGPHLFGDLLAADLVDELCLTVSPLLAGGGAGRIAAGPGLPDPHRMRLLSVLRAEESLLLLRYGRLRA
ncbi:pyrimidine reductase family protein [Saccharopolyspora gregorii]|uniref:Pyrimidine reductase family protein n=1 Tax=Saccharopolyspora gregorii TaxID=33914 RepID=A0ABP6RTH0_9PSEU|nr:pyrimidine reductase family protein [Saccharopolyspora gregorii]